MSLFLTACLTTSGLETGPGALLSTGLISGELGQGLDQQARRKAIDAEVAALSNGATGTETKWTGARNTSGKVVPGQPFEVSGKILSPLHPCYFRQWTNPVCDRPQPARMRTEFGNPCSNPLRPFMRPVVHFHAGLKHLL